MVRDLGVFWAPHVELHRAYVCATTVLSFQQYQELRSFLYLEFWWIFFLFRIWTRLLCPTAECGPETEPWRSTAPVHAAQVAWQVDAERGKGRKRGEKSNSKPSYFLYLASWIYFYLQYPPVADLHSMGRKDQFLILISGKLSAQCLSAARPLSVEHGVVCASGWVWLRTKNLSDLEQLRNLSRI
jgi:hypothetical protein